MFSIVSTFPQSTFFQNRFLVSVSGPVGKFFLKHLVSVLNI